MKILAFTKYSYEGASSRYRFYNYKKFFQKENIEMIIQPLFEKSYLHTPHALIKLFSAFLAYFKRLIHVCEVLLCKKKYDLILLEYELFPYFPPFFEWLLNKRGIKYLVDYDDAIFHKYDMHSNIWIQILLKNKIEKVMEYAKQVIVCNAYLEDYAKKYNAYTFRLPTVVLIDTYKKEMETFQKEAEDDTFVIGWIGSRTTGIYILDILAAMKKFVDTYRNVRFDLVGFDRSLLSDDDIAKCHINIIEWLEKKEIENILNFDIGIMPLHDDAWSKGKCGFKLVQYMSCKKPVIASAVGVNCTLIENDINGILVQNKEDWYGAFETLYLASTERRKKIGSNNFKKIVEQFNIKNNVKQYQEIIHRIVREDGKQC